MNTREQIDQAFMAQALTLAEYGLYSTHPNPRVGCVLVKDNQVIAQGYHPKQGEPHAEVFAIRQAYEQNNIKDLSGVTAYVTLEPCSHTGLTPPCAQALIDHNVARVVAATQDPNPLVAGNGMRMLQNAGIETTVGVLEAQALKINAGFMMRMRQARPWVRLKTAASLDGHTAMANGDSFWITGEAARADTQRFRARADAIITGIGTVLADDPKLNVRFTPPAPYEPLSKQPLRVILDSHLRTPVDAAILKQEGEVLLVCLSSALNLSHRYAHLEHVECIAIDGDQSHQRIHALLTELGKRNINECHLECGATLAGAFLEAHRVDEWVHYCAPCIMGVQAKPLLNIELGRMADVQRFELDDVQRLGEDIRLTLTPHSHEQS